MKQYNAIKARHPDALLLFRVGDFYETFGDDAVAASSILNITLTKRGNGSASEIHLAGFPHHALDNYLPKLVKAGRRVAICDQLEDPKDAVGIVKRGVTELVTPGLLLSDNVLDGKRNNYLAGLNLPPHGLPGLALLDISTGEFFLAESNLPTLSKLIESYSPAEILIARQTRTEFNNHFGEGYNIHGLEDWAFMRDYGYEQLTRLFNTRNLKGFGIEEMEAAIGAAGAILFYLNETEHKELGHLKSVARIDQDNHVWMDRFTVRNLELDFSSNGVSLMEVIDQTSTPMGARLLRQWIHLPLKDKVVIDERLEMVSAFAQDSDLRQNVRNCLKQIGDLQRLIVKIAAKRVTPRELGTLGRALSNIEPLQTHLSDSENTSLQTLASKLDPCHALKEQILQTLVESPPVSATLGGIIREGINEELDQLRSIAFHGKDYLQQIQNREVARTGISSLKVQYNKVFGYYLEVTNAHKDKVPQDWIRKQTLVNAERYITQELKEYEEKILTAESSIVSIEQDIFNKLLQYSLDFVEPVQKNAAIIAQADCLAGFATLASKNNYVRPEINTGRVLNIKAGRHPVIERQMPQGETYIPNDVLLDADNEQIIIITGPNMAGKSALLRQTGLIVILAQIGCFVPADAAEIGLVDKIFTRVGASDNISRGESTFMVEMNETASILNNIGPASLVLMDEIGRGTSTYDGVSIAWSIVEYLHNQTKNRPRTLFATHYHELNELAERFDRIRNFNVSVKEMGNKVIFLRKLQPGGSAHSFGIHVAQMAGMPNSVVIRASQIMKHLEAERAAVGEADKVANIPMQSFQLGFFDGANKQWAEVEKMLLDLDINHISPVEALLKLSELRSRLLDGAGKKR